MTGQDICALAVLTLRDPAAAARCLIGLRLPALVRGQALMLVAILAVLMISLTARLLPAEELTGLGKAMQAPLSGLAIQLCTILLIAALMAGVGRLFGGRGSFADALLLVVWLEFLTLPLSLLQLLLLLVLPLATLPVALVGMGLFCWVFLVFAATLHGFRRLWPVAAASLATLIGVSFVLGMLLVALGYQPVMGTV